MAMRFLPVGDYLRLSRSTPAFVRDANGVLGTVDADIPAFDHDGDGRPLGLRIEGPATNLLRYSNGFDNALWEKDSNVAISSSTIAAPDGRQTATQLDLPGNSAGNGGLYQRVDNLSAGEPHAFAIWMRAVSGTADVTLGGINGPSTHAVSLDESWQRVGFVEAASATTRYPKISTAISGTPASILIWNAQLEQGVISTSDIISPGIPAMRGGDDVGLDLSGAWYRNGAGTFVFDLHLPPAWQGIWRIMQFSSTSLNADHLDLGYDSDADQLRLSLRKGGSQIISQSLYGTLAPGSKVMIAMAFDDDVIAVAANGTVLKSPDGFALPRNFSRCKLGSYDGTGNFLNGWLRGVSYWPGRLSDDRLAGVSALN